MRHQRGETATRGAEEYFRLCRQFRIAHRMGGAAAMRQQLGNLTALHANPNLPEFLAARIARRIAELHAEYSRYLEPRT